MNPTRLRIALGSTAGPAHSANEDAVAIDGWQLSGDGEPFTVELDGASSHVVVLADGMGGHRGGATASSLVARTVSRAEPYAATLAAHVTAAHVRLESISRERPELSGLGSTVLALGWIPSGELTVMTVGDTLAFRVLDGVLGRLTRPERSSRGLLQCVGGGVGVAPRPSFRSLTATPGERYLLCTDGLWETVPPAEIEARVARGTPSHAVSELLAAAAGSGDDVTAVVIDLPVVHS